MINITATTGNLEHLQTVTIPFERSKGVLLQIGALRVQFDVSSLVEDKPSVERTAIQEKLTLVYKITGKIGCDPYSFGLIRPEKIGTNDRVPILVWWRLSQSSNTNDILVLNCSIFSQRTGAPEASTENNHGS